jgi:hypothetical protein
MKLVSLFLETFIGDPDPQIDDDGDEGTTAGKHHAANRYPGYPPRFCFAELLICYHRAASFLPYICGMKGVLEGAMQVSRIMLVCSCFFMKESSAAFI